MPAPFYLFLIFAGSSGGFLSGLLGIGGGIIMMPLLLYVPPLFGFESLPVKDIMGLTMIQGFFASLAAMFSYKAERLVNRSLVLALGLSLFTSSLAGAVFSRKVPDEILLMLFGMLALTASAMMLIPRSYEKDDLTCDKVDFNRTVAVFTGIFIGFFLGMVGQGGAFIIIPIMLYVLKIPLRVALGSTLAIGLFSATAGAAGKIATGQVPFGLAGALLIGAIPAAKLGSTVSRRSKTAFLRWFLALLITATAIKIWTDIFRSARL